MTSVVAGSRLGRYEVISAMGMRDLGEESFSRPFHDRCLPARHGDVMVEAGLDGEAGMIHHRDMLRAAAVRPFAHP